MIIKLRVLLNGGNILIVLLDKETERQKVEESSSPEKWVMTASCDTKPHYKDAMLRQIILKRNVWTPADWNRLTGLDSEVFHMHSLRPILWKSCVVNSYFLSVTHHALNNWWFKLVLAITKIMLMSNYEDSDAVSKPYTTPLLMTSNGYRRAVKVTDFSYHNFSKGQKEICAQAAKFFV